MLEKIEVQNCGKCTAQKRQEYYRKIINPNCKLTMYPNENLEAKNIKICIH